MIDTYVSRRRLEIGDSWREPDEPVPEAHTWRLVETLIRGGQLTKTQLSEADFRAAVQKYCPQDADAIYAVLGLTQVDVNVESKRSSSTRKPKPVLTTEPVEIPAPNADV